MLEHAAHLGGRVAVDIIAHLLGITDMALSGGNCGSILAKNSDLLGWPCRPVSAVSSQPGATLVMSVKNETAPARRQSRFRQMRVPRHSRRSALRSTTARRMSAAFPECGSAIPIEVAEFAVAQNDTIVGS
jgi:hypothetical protein